MNIAYPPKTWYLHGIVVFPVATSVALDGNCAAGCNLCGTVKLVR